MDIDQRILIGGLIITISNMTNTLEKQNFSIQLFYT